MSLVSAPARAPRLLRDRSGVQRVTNIELFFDLVYVFAITQLSHYLLGHADLRAAGVVAAVAASDRLPGLHRPD